MIEMNDGTARINPYVGPRAFKYGEKLYGREAEVPKLRDLLIAERIVLLHSPSGAGKTSLIQAALISELEQNDFTVWPVLRVDLEIPEDWVGGSRLNRYVASVAQSLEPALGENRQNALPELGDQILQQMFSKLRPENEAPAFDVLIFDQFEEIFIVDPTDRSAKQDFFLQLGQLLRDRHRWALFAMREEYIAALNPYLRTVPTHFGAQYHLEFLSEEAARRAIQSPAEAQGVTFETKAAKALVDDLRQVQVLAPDGNPDWKLGPHVEPVQLQVVCRRLWEKRHEENRITEKDIGELAADVSAALAGYYADNVTEVATKTGIDERMIRNWFQLALITKEGFRSRILKRPGNSEGLDNRAIQVLVNTHLVRVEESQYRTWFELAHDRLVKPIREDNDKWREVHLTRWQRQAALWLQQGQPDSLLLGAEDLADAELWAARHEAELAAGEQQYLERSRTKVARHKRWIVLSGSVAIALVAIGLLYLFSEMRSKLPWAYFRDLETGVVYPASAAEATLGRSTEYQNTVSVSDSKELVSPMHVFVTRDRKAFDMRSLHGTTVNAEFLLYGRTRILQSGDIVTLAGVASFRFQWFDYPFYQFWQPKIEDSVPATGWLLFVNGLSREARMLTERQYYLLLDEQGQILLSQEKKSGTLLRIEADEDYYVRIFDEKDSSILQFQFKGGDYESPVIGYYAHPAIIVSSGKWFRMIAWEDSNGTEQKRDITSLDGVFHYERERLRFQLVPIGLLN